MPEGQRATLLEQLKSDKHAETLGVSDKGRSVDEVDARVGLMC